MGLLHQNAMAPWKNVGRKGEFNFSSDYNVFVISFIVKKRLNVFLTRIFSENLFTCLLTILLKQFNQNSFDSSTQI